MKAADFVLEFSSHHFPAEHGPWIGLDDHDPPFTKTELRQMERQGVIELQLDNSRYRLTLKASKMRPQEQP